MTTEFGVRTRLFLGDMTQLGNPQTSSATPVIPNLLVPFRNKTPSRTESFTLLYFVSDVYRSHPSAYVTPSSVVTILFSFGEIIVAPIDETVPVSKDG